VWDLLLENNEDPHRGVRSDGSLGYSLPKMVEFNILREVRKARNKDNDKEL